MEVDISFGQEDVCGVEHEFVRCVLLETLRRSGLDFENRQVHVGVASVSLQEIQNLNKRYRDRKDSTDVLSFPEYPDRKALQVEWRKQIYIGDIILSCEVVRRQAGEDGVSFKRELAYLISHGALHLLGLEHGEKMFSIQDKICDILNS